MSELSGGWIPDEATLADANLTRFMAWLAETDRGEYGDYHALLRKAVDDIEWVLGRRLEFLRHPIEQPPARGAGRAFHAGHRVVSRRHDQLRHRGVPARHR